MTFHVSGIVLSAWKKEMNNNSQQSYRAYYMLGTVQNT